LKVILLVCYKPRIFVVKERYEQSVRLAGNVSRGIVTGLWLIDTSSGHWWIERAACWVERLPGNNA